MDKIKNFLKKHQQKLVLVTGYLLMAAIGFQLGRMTDVKTSTPQIRVEEAFVAPTNYNPTVSGVQSAPSTTGTLDCDGKIKGSSSLIYHMPGGSFYNRTTSPIKCFDTEAEATAAGFRKSSR